MNPERCWDCLHHQRTLVSTRTDRPLFYTSFCVKGFEIRLEKQCPSFHHYLPLSERVTAECGLCQESTPK